MPRLKFSFGTGFRPQERSTWRFQHHPYQPRIAKVLDRIVHPDSVVEWLVELKNEYDPVLGEFLHHTEPKWLLESEALQLSDAETEYVIAKVEHLPDGKHVKVFYQGFLHQPEIRRESEFQWEDE